MPHKSAASRNIGHYIAWKEGFDVIVALDYDCRTRPGWLAAHLDALRPVIRHPGIEPTTPNGWVNPIRQSFPNGDTVYARGYPYELRTPELAGSTQVSTSGRVALNLGVWDGILDLNGIDTLYGGEPGDLGVPPGPSPAALGNIPVCGMNTAFVRELTPAYYFLPDLWVNGWRLSRHDDIWGGYIVKRLMDRRGDLLTYGGPVVEHTKQTALDRVVVLEQWMHLMSMPFYDLVDAAAAEVAPGDYAEMMAHFVDAYERQLSLSRRRRTTARSTGSSAPGCGPGPTRSSRLTTVPSRPDARSDVRRPAPQRLERCGPLPGRRARLLARRGAGGAAARGVPDLPGPCAGNHRRQPGARAVASGWCTTGSGGSPPTSP